MSHQPNIRAVWKGPVGSFPDPMGPWVVEVDGLPVGPTLDEIKAEAGAEFLTRAWPDIQRLAVANHIFILKADAIASLDKAARLWRETPSRVDCPCCVAIGEVLKRVRP